jgi:NAD(P)-dependent dehydrogenase (short-subunit alcohol dehydrogenase family)
MDLQLKGKKAFISGSTQGIGFAIAKRLLEEGTSVVINGRSEEKTNDAVKRLAEMYTGAEISGIAADFSNPADIVRVFEKYPEVDILINNVAIFEPKPFLDIPDEDWIKFYEVNVMSGIRLSRFYFPKMIAKNWGRVLFISSESAINIPEEMVHYGMTKTAQLAVSRGLSELTKSTGVTVNSQLCGGSCKATESEQGGNGGSLFQNRPSNFAYPAFCHTRGNCQPGLFCFQSAGFCNKWCFAES